MIERKLIQSLELQDLSFKFAGGQSVFEDVTFKMPTSRAVWVRSPGGRGKSTLLRLLAGLLSPQKGQYLINGVSVNDLAFEAFLPYRLNMGYGFDMGGLLNNKSLAENLIFPLIYHKLVTQEEAIERVSRITEMFGMQEVQDRRPFEVSGSLRKLTCVLRAFVHSPQVVFLDDPATGLKVEHLSDLFLFAEENYDYHGLKQIFFTSENPELAKRLKAEELLISIDWFTSRSVA